MNMTEATRAYLYRIALALLVVLVVYGLVSNDQVPVWVEVAGAVLGLGGNGLATLNTDRSNNRF